MLLFQTMVFAQLTSSLQICFTKSFMQNLTIPQHFFAKGHSPQSSAPISLSHNTICLILTSFFLSDGGLLAVWFLSLFHGITAVCFAHARTWTERNLDVISAFCLLDRGPIVPFDLGYCLHCLLSIVSGPHKGHFKFSCFCVFNQRPQGCLKICSPFLTNFFPSLTLSIRPANAWPEWRISWMHISLYIFMTIS